MRLNCCTRGREVSFDFDENIGIRNFEKENAAIKREDCIRDSSEDDKSSCSSSKGAFESCYSNWFALGDADCEDGWDSADVSGQFYAPETPKIITHFSDVESMKENYSKLLLGEDMTGGSKGVPSALALSNAITHLAASVFGEVWKLEPLTVERRARWQKEMDWFVSPTNHMVELVPTKQSADNGRMLEIMTPKVRADIHMNLPALQKLDSMLIGVLDSMVNTEFWYLENGKQARRRSLPVPQVPAKGLSDCARKKLLSKRKVVYQVYKAAKSINESVLLDMPVPAIIRNAIPKSAKTSLGEGLYKALSSASGEAKATLHVNSENHALEAVNKMEAAIVAWKEKFSQTSSRSSPSRFPWLISDHAKVESLLARTDALVRQLKARYPRLPPTFLDASKIQHGKDVGHSILEAYSRAIGDVAHRILCRIGEVLEEDALSCRSSSARKEIGDGEFLGKKMEWDICHSETSTAEYFSSSANASSLSGREASIDCSAGN